MYSTISSEDFVSGFTGGIVVTLVDENGNAVSDKIFWGKYGVNLRSRRNIYEKMEFTPQEVQSAYAAVIRHLKENDFDRLNDVLDKAAKGADRMKAISEALKSSAENGAAIFAMFAG